MTKFVDGKNICIKHMQRLVSLLTINEVKSAKEKKGGKRLNFMLIKSCRGEENVCVKKSNVNENFTVCTPLILITLIKAA